MAVLKSSLVAQMHDRVSAPARGIMGTLGRLRRAGNGFARSQASMSAPLLTTARNLAAMGAAYFGIRQGLSSTLGGAMKLETAMADVAKKTTLTTHQLEETRKRIIALSNMKGGMASVEIAKLYAQAGQFGIANNELDRFVKLGSKAAIAFDMTAENTANNLSQLKNALGLSMGGLADLADAINYTADTAGTSEKNLIDFLLRTAASAKTYGITGQQMAAFGATLNEIGIESAKAGTGINAMIAKLAGLTRNKKAVAALDAFGGKGYSAKLQKQFFERPVDAMREFFKVVQKMDVQKRSGLLIDFFGLEYQDDAAAIANNIDKIVGRLETLKDTSKFAGSVDKTFEIFANTSEEKLKRLRRIFANAGSWLGAHLLPPIVAFGDKLSDTLTTLDQRVTVFDKVSASLKGFMTGLGFSADQGLGAAFGQMWDTIFGRVDQLAADTEKMGAAFEQFRQMGADVREFVQSLSDLVSGVDQFLGLDHGTAAGVVADMATWGGLLGASAIGVGLLVGPIRALAKAALVLTGIKPAWGLLRFLSRLVRLGGKAGSVASLATAAGALGRSTKGLSDTNPHGFGTVDKKSGLNGRISQKKIGEMSKRMHPASSPKVRGPNLFGWGGLLSLWNAFELVNAIPDNEKDLQAFFKGNAERAAGMNSWLEKRLGTPRSWLGMDKSRLGPVQGPPTRADWKALQGDGTDAANRFNPMKGFNVLGGLERRLGANGKSEVSVVGTPPVTLAGEPAVTARPSGVQDVRVTNSRPPDIHVTATVTVNEASDGAKVAHEFSNSLRDALSGVQADLGYTGP